MANEYPLLAFAFKGNTWLVPVDTEKPADGRYWSSKLKFE